jgi:glycosyltransferase involved in cell wall biosynthesis
MYGQARVFAYPSWFEGFGFPLLEAMACGVPVVTSNRASIPEVVGDAALTVDPWNADALAAAIARLWHDGSDRTEYIVRGHHRAREFRWDQAAHNLMHVFERVIAFP